MHMFFYLALAAIIYGLLADRTDRAADREIQKRRAESTGPGLMEDFDARPDLAPRYGRRLRSHVRHFQRVDDRPSRMPADSRENQAS
jgi:hypothetical protein